MGESVAKFEQDFCKFTRSKFAVMVSSGSTANLIAIAALLRKINAKKVMKLLSQLFHGQQLFSFTTIWT